MRDKVKTLDELKAILDRERKGKKVVFTNGCFDLLHLGHIRYLEQAKDLGDILVVGLNSDESVKNLKGEGRPLTSESERAEVLAALECLDYVVIFDESAPNRIISELRPEVHVKGGDYQLKDLPEAKIVESYGGKIVIVPEVKGYSTSALLEKIKNQ